MAGQTKMIIITSNEDLIRQFSSNKTIDTHIIGLDNHKQMSSIAKDNNNFINLGFLAGLSHLNSSSDRAVDSPDHNRSKSMGKIPKKSIDFICAICADTAIGYNYDVLSCASCKVFFRRNAAHQHSEKLRCLTSQGRCSVAFEMRRKCPRCRLDRCFAMGMRKDSILNEEEKQRRKKRLEENRNISSNYLSTSHPLSNSESIPPTLDEIDHLSMDMDGNDDDIIVLHESINSNQMEDTSLETLSVEDRVTIQSVRSSFLSIFQSDNTQCACLDLSDRVSALLSWSEFLHQVTLRFISFFLQIDEFEDLHPDDRFILIKYNIFSLFLISKCFYYKPLNDCCSPGENEEAVKHRRFFMLCGAPNGIRDTFVNLVLSLIEATKQDPTFLSLFLTILIFSQGLSMNEDEPPLKDSLVVNQAQSRYTKILWNYLVKKWGELQACTQFTQLLTIIFRIQSVGKRIRELFYLQYMTSDTVDRMAPLMQAALNIS